MEKARGTKDSQETKRLLIVDFIKKKKGTHQQASDLFHVSKSAVDKIWTRYKASGIRGIKSKKRGVQEGKKINGKQSAEVRQLIKDKLPDQLKLAYGLWTREAVQQLILDRYGIELSRWQVGRYLKSWGYTPQKPITKAFEQKPEKAKAWLETEFPAIKKRASKENAIIYFGDETGMRIDHQAGRSDAPAGKTPVIKKTDLPFSLNMISTLSNQGHLQFMIIDGKFNSEVFKTFLLQMIKYSSRKIFFVTDGHPEDRTRMLNEWLSENSNRIEVFFVPPYSPELNPQEHVN
jgi:transposase